MSNELLFFLQIITVFGSVLGALILGKEALVACISFLFVIANLFVIKQISVFGLNVTPTDVYIIGGVLGFNFLQEFYGKKIAEKTIWISFLVSLIFVVMSRIHVWFAPNVHDVTHGLFVKVLGFLPRIAIASFIAHVVAQYFRLFFYGFLKKIFINRYLITRNLTVTVIEQALDTALFSFIGLYGIVYSLRDVFLLSFSVKLITIMCTIPAIVLARFFVRRG